MKLLPGFWPRKSGGSTEESLPAQLEAELHSLQRAWFPRTVDRRHGDPTTAQVAKSMLDTMLDVAWDSERGGFHSAGLSFAPSDIEGTKILVRTKSWWPQAEGLRALLALAQLYPTDPADYRAHLLNPR